MELFTLIAYQVGISCCFAVLYFIAWILFDRPRQALLWFGAYALVALQYLLNLLRDVIPNPQTYWISANIVSFSAVVLMVWGHRVRLNFPDHREHILTLVLLLSAITIWVTAIVDTPSIRIAMAPGFAFVGLTYAAVILVRSNRTPKLAQLVSAAAHMGFGLTQAASAALALRLGVDPSPEAIQLYTVVNFSLMPIFLVAVGLTVFFLLATDLANKFKGLAFNDQLTNIPNRRGFNEATEKLLAQARRTGKPLTLVMCDLDYFKRVNDRYGHAIGDLALQHFARVLTQSIRLEDAVGRLGGEEFALALGGMDASDARVVTSRIQLALDEDIHVSKKIRLHLSASYGIAEIVQGDNCDSLLMRADLAVYQSKAAGRNTISIASPALPPTPGCDTGQFDNLEKKAEGI